MQFHDFPTIYSVLKHNGLTDDPPDRFYAQALALLRLKGGRNPGHAVAVENNRTVCEWDWIKLGSPYFKVYPAMIPLLANVGIDVPVDYLRLPFCSFAVRLPDEDNPLVIDEQYYVRSILACDGQPVDSQERRVYLWLDVGERGMGNNYTLLPPEAELILQQRPGFYWARNRPDLRWFRACWEAMLKWNPLQKIYLYRDEQSAAEDMAFILFQVWKFPLDWCWYVTAAAFNTSHRFEQGRPLPP